MPLVHIEVGSNLMFTFESKERITLRGARKVFCFADERVAVTTYPMVIGACLFLKIGLFG